MHFLLSNDDGIHAPGLAALAETLAGFGRVTVVAPDRDRSGASNSLTLDAPLLVKTDSRGFLYVDGTPTDCVHLAVTDLLKGEEPDMVISGINAGANLGDDVLYSGTVAAAMEGRFLGCPAIAFSLAGEAPTDFSVAADIVTHMVKHVIAHPPAKDVLLNVNIPDVKREEIRGYVATRLGHRHKSEPALQMADDEGRLVYRVGPVGSEQDGGEGTDFHAIRSNQVSVTPIQVDLTYRSALEQVSVWVDGIS